MKRIQDKPYWTYSVLTAKSNHIAVSCPRCGGLGLVTADEHMAYFKCTSCAYVLERDQTIYRYDVHNQCPACGRYYRVDITEESQQHFPALHVACPYCGQLASGPMQRTVLPVYVMGEIKNGCEPYFGLPLWFLGSFGGKPVWALNREHLDYLIGYLSAELRQKRPQGQAVMRSQADHLPTYMKTAKNRKRVIKLLMDLQRK